MAPVGGGEDACYSMRQGGEEGCEKGAVGGWEGGYTGRLANSAPKSVDYIP